MDSSFEVRGAPIAVAPEDRRALVAPAGDVVDRAFIFQTKGPDREPNYITYSRSDPIGFLYAERPGFSGKAAGRSPLQ